MNFEVSYDVDTAMQDASMRQSLYAVFLKPKLWANTFLFLATIVVFLGGEVFGSWLKWLFLFLISFLTIIWVRAYYSLREFGRKRLQLSGNPETRIKINEKEIEFFSNTETRRYSWDKFDRTIETRDFLLIMSGKISLFCIPLRHLPAEVQKYKNERRRIR